MCEGKKLITRRVADADCLQVFEFSGENGKQNIVHRQKEPPYKMLYQFYRVENPLQHKIYVIDDVEYCTMLLCNEY